MVELVKCNFSDFVQTLSEPVIKKIIWDRYHKVKGTSKRVPYQKIPDAAAFGTTCLLEQYALVRGEGELARQCEYIFFQLFQYAPASVMEESVKKILNGSIEAFTYQDYAKTVEYIRKNYGKWLGELEFTKENKEFSYEEAYNTYNTEVAPALKNWEDIKAVAEEQGLEVLLDADALSVHPVVGVFFDTQDGEIKEKYSTYEQWETTALYAGFETLEKIPCKSVDTEELCRAMERKLDEIEREKWQRKLEAFKKVLEEQQLQSGRLIPGDNEEKVRLAEKNYVSSGKFEYVLMINDTSRGLKCKEGMAVTTKNLYYKGRLSGGEIKVQDISHFEITGTLLGQGLAVYTLKGKKILVPCNIGKTEHLKYLKILEELVKILRNQEK